MTLTTITPSFTIDGYEYLLSIDLVWTYDRTGMVPPDPPECDYADWRGVMQDVRTQWHAAASHDLMDIDARIPACPTDDQVSLALEPFVAEAEAPE